jgi:hypothetical protein
VIISHKYRFIFLKTRKTAGTSIEISLGRYCGEADIITPIGVDPEAEKSGHRPRNYSGLFNPLPELLFSQLGEKKRCIRHFMSRRRFWNHLTARAVRARIGRRIWNDYFKFCFERNPWDKNVSNFFWNNRRLEHSLTFDEYIQQGRFVNNWYIYTLEGEPAVDRVCRYENLNEELVSVCNHLGLPFDGWMPRAKSQTRVDLRKYQEFFDEDQRQIIADYYKREIEMLGYSF